MLPKLSLESITERDMDLLVLEEIMADAAFREAMVHELEPDLPHGWTFHGAWHSISHPDFGESDLLMTIADGEAHIHAFLIENKIDAPPQPEQAARYRKRGHAGIEEGDWQVFTTCIIGPERYLQRVGDAQLYDGAISYEWIERWLGEHGSFSTERGRFRRQMITQAIEQSRRGYSPKHDERVTAFWRGYWDQARTLFPELGMSEPVSKPGNADWIPFNPAILPDGYKILHKLQFGAVDLQMPFADDATIDLAKHCQHLLQDDMQAVPTGKSVSIRVNVPQLDRFKDYESQKQEAYQGMKAAYRLVYLAAGIHHACRVDG